MVGLRAFAHPRFFDFDEIADLGFFLEHRAGAQPCIRADFAVRADGCALDMAECADFGVVGNTHTGAEEDVGLDQNIAANHRIIGEPDSLWRDQRCAVIHRAKAAALLPFALDACEFGPAVDASDVERISLHHRTAAAIGVGNIDDINEVKFLRRIIISDAREEAEQVTRLHRHQPRIAEATGALLWRRILMLDHFGDAVAVGNHPSVRLGVNRFKCQHDDRRGIRCVQTVNHPLHRVRRHERHIAVEDQDVTFKTRQRGFGHLHRVACAILRLLNRKFSRSSQSLFKLILATADNNDLLRRR